MVCVRTLRCAKVGAGFKPPAEDQEDCQGEVTLTSEQVWRGAWLVVSSTTSAQFVLLFRCTYRGREQTINPDVVRIRQ